MPNVEDPLLEYRQEFPALDNCVHMVSHSLGCMPIKAAEYLNTYLELWHSKSITVWDEWLPEVDAAAARIGKILSAPQGSVIMHTNVSQVMAVLASCLEYTAKKNKIVYEDIQFPTVSYVWKAEERRGAKVELVPSKDGISLDTDALCAAIDETTIAVPISHVVYRSAFIQDVKAVVKKAREVGAHVILDCYQSIGIVPIDVVDLGVSFACGGSVKFMCGGPGAGWLYVREDLIQEFEPRVTGWFGNEAPFAFTMPAQSYADNIWRYMAGTPAIAALYQARAGAEIVGEIGVHRIREKSLRQTKKMIDLVDERKYQLNSPREDNRRGGSVVFNFAEAASVTRELNARRFFCDHRPGVGLRISPHFYTKDEEIDLVFDEIDRIVRGDGQLMKKKSDAEWKAELSDEQYRVMREKGTERAFTGAYWDCKDKGMYRCAACHEPLFSSDDKFDSGSGWPSFTKPVDGQMVETETDQTHGMVRTEVLCKSCGAHLGHVFPDGPGPEGTRFCINSASLELDKDKP